LSIQLKKILIKAKRQVFSELIGNNPSMFRGEGYDFFELREYEIGDDTRHIDWVITAKMSRPYVKVFHKEHQINVAIVPILNGSVFFGTARLKQEVIAEISAILGFSTIKNGDNFRTFIMADKLYHETKATKKINGVEMMTNLVNDFNAVDKVFDPLLIEKKLMLKLKRKSLIFLIGDFFTLPELHLMARKHEVIAIVVRDRAEENLPDLGESTLIDPESGAYYEGGISSAQKRAYAAKVKMIDKENEQMFRKHQIRFVKIYTDEDPFKKLLTLFRMA
jgi:uncharacterized protein (DUF58 family)